MLNPNIISFGDTNIVDDEYKIPWIQIKINGKLVGELGPFRNYRFQMIDPKTWRGLGYSKSVENLNELIRMHPTSCTKVVENFVYETLFSYTKTKLFKEVSDPNKLGYTFDNSNLGEYVQTVVNYLSNENRWDTDGWDN